jgi:hypothetical protein
MNWIYCFPKKTKDAVINGRIEGMLKLEELYMQLPQKPNISIVDLYNHFDVINDIEIEKNSKVNTPVPSTLVIKGDKGSPVNTEGLSMENVFNDE